MSADVEMRSHQRANATAKEARVIYVVSNEVNRSASCILSIRTVSNTGPNRPMLYLWMLERLESDQHKSPAARVSFPLQRDLPRRRLCSVSGGHPMSIVQDSPGPGLGHGHHAPGLVSPLPPLACDNSTEPKRAGG